jgi:aminoglycoside phosphotransferase
MSTPALRAEAPFLPLQLPFGYDEPARIVTLRGHSGAMLRLIGRAVRKTAGRTERNARLLRQCAIQRQLWSYGISVPRVLGEGHDEAGRAWFDMDYVPADTLAAEIARGTALDLPATVAALEWLLRFFQLTEGEALPASPFFEKIDQIETDCRTLPACASLQVIIAAAAGRLRTLDWSGIPSSLSHGDLTLENILFVPSRGLVFIDCDRAFVSSWWLDAGKLFQDIEGYWCVRELYSKSAGAHAGALATRRLDRLAPALRAMTALCDRGLAMRLPQFAALHLFRTLPYADDEGVAGFALERLMAVLDRAQL